MSRSASRFGRRRQAQLAQQAVQAAHAGASTTAPAQAAAHPGPVPPASPASVNQSEAVLRRLALLLEQSLEARGPQYRRRSDLLDKGFDDD